MFYRNERVMYSLKLLHGQAALANLNMHLVVIAVIVFRRSSSLQQRTLCIDVEGQKALHACPRGRGPSPPHLPLGQGFYTSCRHPTAIHVYASYIQPCPPGHHAR